MPKKKAVETQEEQSERFRAAVRMAIDAGELSPTEAEHAIDRILDRERGTRKVDQ